MALTKKKPVATDAAINGVSDSLVSTVGSFENRLNKRLAEKEKASSQAEQDAAVRNDRILQALSTIRKALQQTQKIKLGDRFNLDLDVNDWNGWPRLELNLVDSLAPENQDFGLLVTAHDRKESGTVEFRTKSGVLLGDLSLLSDSEMSKIPVVLKKSVRSYLDSVAEYVLNPKSANELAAQKIELEEEIVDPESQKLKSVDVFSEDDMNYDQNQVKIETNSPDSLDVTFEK